MDKEKAKALSKTLACYKELQEGIDIQSYSKRAEITPPSMFTMYFVVVSARHLFALP